MRRLAALALAALLTGPAAAQPIERPALERLEQRLAAGEIPGAHGVIVVQDGRTLLEWYGKGRDQSIFKPPAEVAFGPETLHDVRSVTKSVVGLLVGIAVGEGAIKDLDAPVLDYFPEHKDLRTPERLRITLRHMLTMTSGLAWDEFTYPYTDPRNSEIAMAMSPDPYRYVLTQTFVAAPGERFAYSGGDVETMAAVLARATNTPIEAYAKEKLFGPLGIERYEWIKNRGTPMAASGLRLTPRDMAKIGQLVLDEGRHQGRQVVPAAWIKDATRPHATLPPGTPIGQRYGYFFWLWPDADPARIGAVGLGGQRIWIIPSRDLVVVSTMGLYDSRQQGEASEAILAGALAP